MEAQRRVNFSWLGFFVAPLPVLFAAGILMTVQAPTFSLSSLLVTALLGSPIAYLGTAMAAGCLLLISKVAPVHRLTSALCGLFLAALEYLGYIWLSWSSSGPDSGPPVDSLLSHLKRDWNDPLAFIFLGCGTATALVYDHLTWRRHRLSDRPKTVSS